MTSVPATIAAEQLIAKQALTLSVIKQNAERDQQLARLLEEASRNVPLSATHGTNINIRT